MQKIREKFKKGVDKKIKMCYVILICGTPSAKGKTYTDRGALLHRPLPRPPGSLKAKERGNDAEAKPPRAAVLAGSSVHSRRVAVTPYDGELSVRIVKWDTIR